MEQQSSNSPDGPAQPRAASASDTRFRQVVVDLITLTALLAPMVLSAGVVAAVIYVTGVAERWRWPHWLTLSPLLYTCWLLAFLSFSALICRQMGKKFPKPRYAVARSQQGTKPDLGLVTALVCYRRLAIVQTLPLVRLIDQTETLKRLVLRA